MNLDWQGRFLDMATLVAGWSKDPSTKVGCVVVNKHRQVISVAYNGFPRGVEDMPERLADRATKYRLTQHAEVNALAFATAPLDGCTMVVTHPCCAQCAGAAIQAGIATVIYPTPDDAMAARWADDMALTTAMFREAGVAVVNA